MQKKLTISVDEKFYEDLHTIIGRGNISRFLEDMARPRLNLEARYRAMTVDAGEEEEASAGLQIHADSTETAQNRKKALLKLCHEMAQTAKRNGMTEEILASILHGDD